MTATNPRPLALRFLSGRLEGGVVPLQPGSAIVIGRQPGADVLIGDDLVSRRHARVMFDGSAVVVEDLESTNGTFVNGARVLRAQIAEGDRVLIGESVFTLVVRQRSHAISATAVRPLVDAPTITGDGRTTHAIAGRLEEVPLYDLLQLLATARKSGILTLRSGERVAEVRLDRGRVVGCSLDARADLAPQKAMFRLFGWASGQFELRPAAADEEPQPPLAESTDALLLEAAHQFDEMRRLRATLPVRFVVSDDVPEVALDEEDRALVALAARLGTLDGVLDATPLADVAAAQRLASLHARGVIVGGGGVG
jgi:pSer/pThr/pTyr-binding forkhead associated (FHA) protein